MGSSSGIHQFSFTLCQLEVCHSAEIAALEAIILDSLPPEHKTYIVAKSIAQIEKNLQKPHVAVGVFTEDKQLIGTAFLLANAPGQPLKGLTDCGNAQQLVNQAPKTGVIGTVMVHPQHRKKYVMSTMLSALKTAAIKHDFHAVMAEVVIGNNGSYTGFAHSGFKIAGQGIDPSDGTPLHFLKINLPRPAPVHTPVHPQRQTALSLEA